MKYYIGIDNGGTNVKAAIYDASGRELASKGARCVPVSPNPGWTERDSEELWAANCEVCRGAIEKAGINPADIACVTVTGHGKGMYLWGYDGKPSYPGIVSTDTRAQEYSLRWKADMVLKETRPWMYQCVIPCQPACIAAWMLDNKPEVMERTQYIFAVKDYIRFRLTGVATSERSDCSGTGLVDIETGEYDYALLPLLGLESCADKLPPLCESFEVAGTVTPEAAALSGIPAGTPVAGGAMDINACALASGVIDEDKICMIAGTWCINECLISKPVLDGGSLLNSCFCIPGIFLIEESSPTNSVNNEWFIDQLLPEAAAEAARRGESIYNVMNGWVESLGKESFCPVFLPFIAASNVHPHARGSFVGISSEMTRAHLAKSIYEGIVFSHRYHYEKLLKARSCPPKTIRLAGGLTRSPVWVQIFADALQLPVECVPAKETGSLGCAIIGAAATGGYVDIREAVNSMTEILPPVMPDPSVKELYDRKYAAYLKTIECLDGLWDELKALKDFEE